MRLSNESSRSANLVSLTQLPLRLMKDEAGAIVSALQDIELALPDGQSYLVEHQRGLITFYGNLFPIERFKAGRIDSGLQVDTRVVEGGVLLEFGRSATKFLLSNTLRKPPPGSIKITDIGLPIEEILEYAKLYEAGDTSDETDRRKAELLRRIGSMTQTSYSPRESPLVRSTPSYSGESVKGGCYGSKPG